MNTLPYYLGFDTSNYTTSVALYESGEGTIRHSRQLLPVEPGQLGLRQSDALFHHVRRLPGVMEEVLGGQAPIGAVCASEKPRNLSDSYMPCFLAGAAAAKGIALALGAPYYGTAHQDGHLAAALYSAGRLDLMDRPFLGFHISGGTMEVVRVVPGKTDVFAIRVLGHTLDLSAGQLIDRVGARLGLSFPAGPQLEALAAAGTTTDKRVIPLRDGCCNLSGMENVMDRLLEAGTPPADAARFLLNTLADLLWRMTRAALEQVGRLPVVYSGGVLCNGLIRARLGQGDWESVFAAPEFSSDNAAGVAVLGYYTDRLRRREG